MTPPRTLVDAIARNRYLRQRWPRRGLVAVIVLICTLFAFFPERYRAAVTLTPTDPSSLGLSGALGQLGAINSAFGSQAALEVALRVSHSTYTRTTVMRRLHLVQRLGYQNETQVSRWLDRKVGARSMRGGIVQIDYLGRDRDFGRELVAAYAVAIQERIAEIARRQTAYKRQILLQLVDQSEKDFAIAQANYNRFRLGTRYSDPSYAIAAIGARIPAIEGAIKTKQVELNAARQFATDDNMSVRQIVAEIDALNVQLGQLRALNPQEENSIGRVVQESTQSERLERKLFMAKLLYDSYVRYLQGTSVEDMTSMANIRILEPPFIDTERQINYTAVGWAVFFIFLLMAIEFYEARPPLGDRLVRDDEPR